MGLVIAVLGLGEAGGALAADLAAGGADVRGWDPRPDRGARATSAPDAVRGSDVVLSVNDAGVAVQAAREVADELRDGQVYADLNTGGAPLKRELAGVVAPTGALFADVALMAPVPGTGVRTPALASGPGAEAFAARLAPLGMPVEVIGPEPGAAATRKLLRSVFMKGLAATCLESLAAARAAGSEDWMRDEIASVLDGCRRRSARAPGGRQPPPRGAAGRGDGRRHRPAGRAGRARARVARRSRVARGAPRCLSTPSRASAPASWCAAPSTRTSTSRPTSSTGASPTSRSRAACRRSGWPASGSSRTTPPRPSARGWSPRRFPASTCSVRSRSTAPSAA